MIKKLTRFLISKQPDLKNEVIEDYLDRTVVTLDTNESKISLGDVTLYNSKILDSEVTVNGIVTLDRGHNMILSSTITSREDPEFDAEERHVIERALDTYWMKKAEKEHMMHHMERTEFKMGDIVSEKSDGFLKIEGDEKPGKVVGFDMENGYYRVYFNKWMNYVGVNEENLVLYAGADIDIPEDVKSARTLADVLYIGVNLDEEESREDTTVDIL